MDKSLDEDRDKQINQLKRMLKDKDKLLHIKNGKFVELEITNGEIIACLNILTTRNVLIKILRHSNMS